MMEVYYMSISYQPLWDYLSLHKLNRMILRDNGIHPVTIAKMGRSEYIDLETIEKICKILGCSISDIISLDDNDKKSHE